MRLIFIRHGETQDNLSGIASGRRDTALTEKGRKEARALAKRLKNERIDIIYSSTLKRAINTAKIINEFHGAPLIPKKDLMEYNWGKWEGVELNKVFEERAKLKKKYKSKKKIRAPGGESFYIVEKRVGECVKKIMNKHPEDTILIVAHGGVNKVIFNYLFDLGLDDFSYIGQSPGCINVIQEKYGFLQISLVNDISHLKNNLP